jgi:hypothetical protein
MSPPSLDPGRVSCDQTGRVEKPAGDRHAAAKGARFLGEQQKYGLRCILGELGIAEIPAAYPMDKPHVPVHQLGERRLGIPLNVFSQ